MFDGKLLNYTDIAVALQTIAQKDEQGRPVALPPTLILANEFSNEVLTWLAMQKRDAGLQLCPVRGPHQTSVRTGYYEDIGVMSGGQRLGNGRKAM